MPTPRYQLVNFGSIFLNIGETKTLNATITSNSMAVWIHGKGFVIEPGLLLHVPSLIMLEDAIVIHIVGKMIYRRGGGRGNLFISGCDRLFHLLE